MSIKNLVALTSISGTVITYILFNTRDFGVCKIYCGPGIDTIQNVFIFFPLIFLFSLLTYKLPDRTFSGWWSFAKYAVPVVFLVLLVINLELFRGQTAGMGGWGSFMRDAANLYITLFVYSAFILGSLIAIFRGWRNK